MATDRERRSSGEPLRRSLLGGVLWSLLLTAAAMVAVELTDQTPLRVPGLAVMLLMPPFIAFLHGLSSGMISVAIVALYSIYYFSAPGEIFSYTDEDLRRLLTLPTLSLVLTLMVGISRRAMRATEERLRRQLAFANALTGSLGEGVCTLDDRGDITFTNPAAERMLDRKREELLGENLHRSSTPDAQQALAGLREETARWRRHYAPAPAPSTTIMPSCARTARSCPSPARCRRS